ncbi:hypothetical protein AMELA_G00098370, partial [Ameiurus melas]
GARYISRHESASKLLAAEGNTDTREIPANDRTGRRHDRNVNKHTCPAVTAVNHGKAGARAFRFSPQGETVTSISYYRNMRGFTKHKVDSYFSSRQLRKLEGLQAPRHYSLAVRYRRPIQFYLPIRDPVPLTFA